MESFRNFVNDMSIHPLSDNKPESDDYRLTDICTFSTRQGWSLSAKILLCGCWMLIRMIEDNDEDGDDLVVVMYLNIWDVWETLSLEGICI